MAKKTQTFTDICDLLEKNQPSFINGVTPRDSDKVLFVQWLQLKVGLELNKHQIEKIYSAASFESVRRTRAKLQSQGKYHGSPEVMRKRRIKGYEIQQVEPSESPEGLQRRIEENA